MEEMKKVIEALEKGDLYGAIGNISLDKTECVYIIKAYDYVIQNLNRKGYDTPQEMYDAVIKELKETYEGQL